METKKTFYEEQLEEIANKNGLPQYLYIHLRQSKAFMEKHLSEKIKLEHIAAAAFMSRFHYIRVFQQVYGVTPRQFLRDKRVAKAKELLQMGMGVTQVCFEVGYESLPTFSNAFKRGTGYSPTAYRDLNKKQSGISR